MKYLGILRWVSLITLNVWSQWLTCPTYLFKLRLTCASLRSRVWMEWADCHVITCRVWRSFRKFAAPGNENTRWAPKQFARPIFTGRNHRQVRQIKLQLWLIVMSRPQEVGLSCFFYVRTQKNLGFPMLSGTVRVQIARTLQRTATLPAIGLGWTVAKLLVTVAVLKKSHGIACSGSAMKHHHIRLRSPANPSEWHPHLCAYECYMSKFIKWSIWHCYMSL